MVVGIPKIWLGLLLLAFAYGASCSALHYGQAGRGNHAQHLAALAGAADPSHQHPGHAAPAPASEPASTDLECCAFIGLSAKNLAQLQTAPEDMVPWVAVVFGWVLTDLLFPFSLPYASRWRRPLAINLPQTLVQRKTCLLC